MDENLTTIKWNIDQYDETYYEVHLYRYLESHHKRKLSTIKVIARENEIEKRTLTIDEVESLFFAIKRIKIKFDQGNLQDQSHPYDEYRLRLKNSNFNLDFKWTSNGIYGNEALYVSLNYVIKILCDIKAFNLTELGLEPKE